METTPTSHTAAPATKKEIPSGDKIGGLFLLFLGFVYFMVGCLVSVSARSSFDIYLGIPLVLSPGIALMYLGMETRLGKKKSYTYRLAVVVAFAPAAFIGFLG